MKQEPKEEYKQKLKLKDLQPEFPKVYSEICCPSCNTAVPADNMNINDKIAKCNSCNVVFPFKQEINNLQQPIAKSKTEVVRPAGIELFNFKGETEISVKQPITPLDVLGIFGLPIIAIFLVVAVFLESIFFLFLAAPIVIGTIYWFAQLISGKKNRVFIDINDEFLSVKWRPKKLQKDKYYEVNDIEQVYIAEYYPGTNYYVVMMIVNGVEGQEHVKLIPHYYTNNRAHVQFLEQEIERALGIEDKPVVGEV